MLDKNKKTILVFIGTNSHYVDNIAPTIGTLIAKRFKRRKDLIVLGTTTSEVNARNSNSYAELLDTSSNEFEVVAIDIGVVFDKKRFKVVNRGIKPASGMNRKLKPIGDKSIIIDFSGVYGGNNLSCIMDKLISNKLNKKIVKTRRRRIIEVYEYISKLLEEKLE